jgi:ABC-type transport system involved in cytochrome c biogenesis permease component
VHAATHDPELYATLNTKMSMLCICLGGPVLTSLSPNIVDNTVQLCKHPVSLSLLLLPVRLSAAESAEQPPPLRRGCSYVP